MFKKLEPDYFNFNNNLTVIGAGGYGLVVDNNNYIIKLLYNINDYNALENECMIQLDAAKILNNDIDAAKVPHIYSHTIKRKTLRGIDYLCGIAMERVLGLPEFGGQLVHLMLGASPGEQLNYYAGSKLDEPIGPDNPSRGYFASREKIIDIWDQRDSQWTIDGAAELIGRTCKLLLNNGIKPIDLEFVYGLDDNIYVIDFGLCRRGTADPQQFLEARGLQGLASEPYIPQEGQLGREAFLRGYWGV